MFEEKILYGNIDLKCIMINDKNYKVDLNIYNCKGCFNLFYWEVGKIVFVSI